jgi:hypothetical protein
VTLNLVFVPEGNIYYTVFNIFSYLVQNTEFERFVTDFRYFRIPGVKVIVPPRLSTNPDITVMQPGRLTIDWADEQDEDLLGDDGSKEIFAYSTKPVTFKFSSPNAILRTETNNLPYNYKEWTPCIQISDPMPGYLKVTSWFTIRLTVEIIVEFRGNQTNRTDNTLFVHRGKKEVILKGKDTQEFLKSLNTKASKANEEEEEEDSGESDFLQSEGKDSNLALGAEEDVKEEMIEEKKEGKKEEKKEEKKERPKQLESRKKCKKSE